MKFRISKSGSDPDRPWVVSKGGEKYGSCVSAESAMLLVMCYVANRLVFKDWVE